MLGAERRQGDDANATTIWHVAEDRIPATGEFFVPVENHEFWASKLKELSVTRSHQSFGMPHGDSTREADGSDIDLQPFENSRPSANENAHESLEVCTQFRHLWTGVPGFEIVDGTVFVNGGAIEEAYVLPEYRDHLSTPRTVVPMNNYFVLGDHRNSSNDSRTWGFVERPKIYGKAVFSYWPPDKIVRVR